MLVVLLLPFAAASGQDASEQPRKAVPETTTDKAPDVETIIRQIDRIYRADSSYARLEMRIVTENWERTLDMGFWTEGMDRTFIVVNAPLKDKGITTLRAGTEMWNYFPKRQGHEGAAVHDDGFLDGLRLYQR